MKTGPMLTILLFIILCYLLLCALAFLWQTRLIFPRTTAEDAAYAQYAGQHIALAGEDALLSGWQLEDPAADNALIILYFGGNAEDVISLLPILQKMGARHTYAFNYRGYGRSEGTPSQAALYADAEVIYDELGRRHNLDTSQVVVIGRSLGSAVAGYLATQRRVDKLVLLTPLKSAIQNGKRMFPILPVTWLLQHPFELITYAEQFTCPVLMLVGDADVVIPPKDSLATYAAIQSPKELLELPGVGHNNLFDNPNALKAIRDFVLR